MNYRITVVELPSAEPRTIEPIDVAVATQQVFHGVFVVSRQHEHQREMAKMLP